MADVEEHALGPDPGHDRPCVIPEGDVEGDQPLRLGNVGHGPDGAEAGSECLQRRQENRDLQGVGVKAGIVDRPGQGCR